MKLLKCFFAALCGFAAISMLAQPPLPSPTNGGGGGGGTGTVTVVGAGALTSAALVTGGGTTTLQTPSSAATLDTSGNLAVTSVSTGTSAPTCTAGTAGLICLKEGTAGTGEASAALLYSKTDHLLYANLNNGGEVQVPTASSTATFTNKTYDTAGTGNSFKINGTTVSSVAGNTSKVQLAGAGSPATNDCAKFDANGNIVTAGSACGSGGGVTISTSGQGWLSIPNGGTTQVTSGATYSSKVPRYQQFVNPYTLTISKIGFYPQVGVGTCGGGNCGFAAAIYDASCNKVSGSNVTTSTSFTSSTVTWLTMASPVTLSPGVYQLGTATDSAALVLYAANDGTVFSSIVQDSGSSGGYRKFTGSNSATGDNGSLAMPSSCGTQSVSSGAFDVAVMVP